MSKHDSTKLETVKIVMLKGEKGEKGDGSYDDAEVRGLITAEAQARASEDNSLGMTKADKTEVNELATNKADKTDVTALASRVRTTETDINVLDARMDTFASLPSGSTSGNAELLDIRVGANGMTYPSAGDAVRGQDRDLKTDINLSNEGKQDIEALSPFVQGAMWEGEIKQYGKYEVTSQNLITFSEETELNIASGFWVQFAFFVNGTFSYDSPFNATYYKIPAGTTVRILIRREVENTSELADIGEFTSAVTLINPIGDRVNSLESNVSVINLVADSSVKSKGGINSYNYSELGITSVKQLPYNSIWGIASDITPAMISDLPTYDVDGQIKKIAGITPNDIYIIYEYTNSRRERYIAWQDNENASLSAWTKLAIDALFPISARTRINSSSKVIFIGDSIVAGVGGTGWQQESGRKLLTYDGVDLYANDNGVCWANMMRDYLITNYGCEAYNNGLSGFNSVNIPQNIAQLVPSDATHVIACWGINDRAYDYDTIGGYQTVINYCNSIGAKIIPVTICPCLQPNNIYPHTQYEILTRIKTVCANNSIEVCDLFSAVHDYFFAKGIELDTNYIPDNLHPNDAMYAIMYHLMRRLLGV